MMNVTEVRQRGRELGIGGLARLRKGAMIRTIQRGEGNQDCYGASWRFDCPQLDCCWRKDCLTQNPG